MKAQEIKTFWNLAKIFWIIGFVFWILETSIFLIIEGWHWKATHPIEIYCDEIVVNIWTTALNITTFVCVSFLLNIKKIV